MTSYSPTQPQGRREKDVLYLPSNDDGRDFLVGDIHGCLDLLEDKLDQVEFCPSVDRLIAVGDLIDRGPDSMGVLSLLHEPWFFSVLGNHEDMMVRALNHRDSFQAQLWAMDQAPWAHQESLHTLRGVASVLERLPLVIVVGTGADRYNVVHAEAPRGDAHIDRGAAEEFDSRDREHILWSRRLASAKAGRLPARRRGLSTTYCGHNPLKEVVRRDSHVMIDTGAVFGGKLTLHEHTAN